MSNTDVKDPPILAQICYGNILNLEGGIFENINISEHLYKVCNELIEYQETVYVSPTKEKYLKYSRWIKGKKIEDTYSENYLIKKSLLAKPLGCLAVQGYCSANEAFREQNILYDGCFTLELDLKKNDKIIYVDKDYYDEENKILLMTKDIFQLNNEVMIKQYEEDYGRFFNDKSNLGRNIQPIPNSELLKEIISIMKYIKQEIAKEETIALDPILRSTLRDAEIFIKKEKIFDVAFLTNITLKGLKIVIFPKGLDDQNIIINKTTAIGILSGYALALDALRHAFPIIKERLTKFISKKIKHFKFDTNGTKNLMLPGHSKPNSLPYHMIKMYNSSSISITSTNIVTSLGVISIKDFKNWSNWFFYLFQNVRKTWKYEVVNRRETMLALNENWKRNLIINFGMDIPFRNADRMIDQDMFLCALSYMYLADNPTMIIKKRGDDYSSSSPQPSSSSLHNDSSSCLKRKGVKTNHIFSLIRKKEDQIKQYITNMNNTESEIIINENGLLWKEDELYDIGMELYTAPSAKVKKMTSLLNIKFKKVWYDILHENNVKKRINSEDFREFCVTSVLYEWLYRRRQIFTDNKIPEYDNIREELKYKLPTKNDDHNDKWEKIDNIINDNNIDDETNKISDMLISNHNNVFSSNVDNGDCTLAWTIILLAERFCALYNIVTYPAEFYDDAICNEKDGGLGLTYRGFSKSDFVHDCNMIRNILNGYLGMINNNNLNCEELQMSFLLPQGVSISNIGHGGKIACRGCISKTTNNILDSIKEYNKRVLEIKIRANSFNNNNNSLDNETFKNITVDDNDVDDHHMIKKIILGSSTIKKMKKLFNNARLLEEDEHDENQQNNKRKRKTYICKSNKRQKILFSDTNSDDDDDDDDDDDNNNNNNNNLDIYKSEGILGTFDKCDMEDFYHLQKMILSSDVKSAICHRQRFISLEIINNIARLFKTTILRDRKKLKGKEKNQLKYINNSFRVYKKYVVPFSCPLGLVSSLNRQCECKKEKRKPILVIPNSFFTKSVIDGMKHNTLYRERAVFHDVAVMLGFTNSKNTNTNRKIENWQRSVKMVKDKGSFLITKLLENKSLFKSIRIDREIGLLSEPRILNRLEFDKGNYYKSNSKTEKWHHVVIDPNREGERNFFSALFLLVSNSSPNCIENMTLTTILNRANGFSNQILPITKIEKDNYYHIYRKAILDGIRECCILSTIREICIYFNNNNNNNCNDYLDFGQKSGGCLTSILEHIQFLFKNSLPIDTDSIQWEKEIFDLRECVLNLDEGGVLIALSKFLKSILGAFFSTNLLKQSNIHELEILFKESLMEKNENRIFPSWIAQLLIVYEQHLKGNDISVLERFITGSHLLESNNVLGTLNVTLSTQEFDMSDVNFKERAAWIVDKEKSNPSLTFTYIILAVACYRLFFEKGSCVKNVFSNNMEYKVCKMGALIESIALCGDVWTENKKISYDRILEVYMKSQSFPLDSKEVEDEIHFYRFMAFALGFYLISEDRMATMSHDIHLKYDFNDVSTEIWTKFIKRYFNIFLLGRRGRLLCAPLRFFKKLLSVALSTTDKHMKSIALLLFMKRVNGEELSPLDIINCCEALVANPPSLKDYYHSIKQLTSNNICNDYEYSFFGNACSIEKYNLVLKSKKLVDTCISMTYDNDNITPNNNNNNTNNSTEDDKKRGPSYNKIKKKGKKHHFDNNFLKIKNVNNTTLTTDNNNNLNFSNKKNMNDILQEFENKMRMTQVIEHIIETIRKLKLFFEIDNPFINEIDDQKKAENNNMYSVEKIKMTITKWNRLVKLTAFESIEEYNMHNDVSALKYSSCDMSIVRPEDFYKSGKYTINMANKLRLNNNNSQSLNDNYKRPQKRKKKYQEKINDKKNKEIGDNNNNRMIESDNTTHFTNFEAQQFTNKRIVDAIQRVKDINNSIEDRNRKNIINSVNVLPIFYDSIDSHSDNDNNNYNNEENNNNNNKEGVSTLSSSVHSATPSRNEENQSFFLNRSSNTSDHEMYVPLECLYKCFEGIHPLDQVCLYKKLVMKPYNKLWVHMNREFIRRMNLWGYIGIDNLTKPYCILVEENEDGEVSLSNPLIIENGECSSIPGISHSKFLNAKELNKLYTSNYCKGTSESIEYLCKKELFSTYENLLRDDKKQYKLKDNGLLKDEFSLFIIPNMEISVDKNTDKINIRINNELKVENNNTIHFDDMERSIIDGFKLWSTPFNYIPYIIRKATCHWQNITSTQQQHQDQGITTTIIPIFNDNFNVHSNNQTKLGCSMLLSISYAMQLSKPIRAKYYSNATNIHQREITPNWLKNVALHPPLPKQALYEADDISTRDFGVLGTMHVNMGLDIGHVLTDHDCTPRRSGIVSNITENIFYITRGICTRSSILSWESAKTVIRKGKKYFDKEYNESKIKKNNDIKTYFDISYNINKHSSELFSDYIFYSRLFTDLIGDASTSSKTCPVGWCMFLADPIRFPARFVSKQKHLNEVVTNAGVAMSLRYASCRRFNRDMALKTGGLLSIKMEKSTNNCISLERSLYYLINGRIILGGQVEGLTIEMDTMVKNKITVEKYLVYSLCVNPSLAGDMILVAMEGNSAMRGLAVMEYTHRLWDADKKNIQEKEFWSLTRQLSNSSFTTSFDEIVDGTIIDEPIMCQQQEQEQNKKVPLLTPPAITCTDEDYIFLDTFHRIASIPICQFQDKTERNNQMATIRCYKSVVDQMTGKPVPHILYIFRMIMNFCGFILVISTMDGVKAHHLLYDVALIGINMAKKIITILVGIKGNNAKSTVARVFEECLWSMVANISVKSFNDSCGSTSSTQANLAGVLGKKMVAICDEVGYQGNEKCDTDLNDPIWDQLKEGSRESKVLQCIQLSNNNNNNNNINSIIKANNNIIINNNNNNNNIKRNRKIFLTNIAWWNKRDMVILEKLNPRYMVAFCLKRGIVPFKGVEKTLEETIIENRTKIETSIIEKHNMRNLNTSLNYKSSKDEMVQNYFTSLGMDVNTKKFKKMVQFFQTPFKRMWLTKDCCSNDDLWEDIDKAKYDKVMNNITGDNDNIGNDNDGNIDDESFINHEELLVDATVCILNNNTKENISKCKNSEALLKEIEKKTKDMFYDLENALTTLDGVTNMLCSFRCFNVTDGKIVIGTTDWWIKNVHTITNVLRPDSYTFRYFEHLEEINKHYTHMNLRKMLEMNNKSDSGGVLYAMHVFDPISNTINKRITKNMVKKNHILKNIFIANNGNMELDINPQKGIEEFIADLFFDPLHDPIKLSLLNTKPIKLNRATIDLVLNELNTNNNNNNNGKLLECIQYKMVKNPYYSIHANNSIKDNNETSKLHLKKNNSNSTTSCNKKSSFDINPLLFNIYNYECSHGKKRVKLTTQAKENNKLLNGQFNCNMIKRVVSTMATVQTRGIFETSKEVLATIALFFMSNSYTYQFGLDTAMQKRILVFPCETILESCNKNVHIFNLMKLLKIGLKTIHSGLIRKRNQIWNNDISLQKKFVGYESQDWDQLVYDIFDLENAMENDSAKLNDKGIIHEGKITSFDPLEIPCRITQHMLQYGAYEISDRQKNAAIITSGNSFFTLYYNILLGSYSSSLSKKHTDVVELVNVVEPIRQHHKHFSSLNPKDLKTFSTAIELARCGPAMINVETAFNSLLFILAPFENWQERRGVSLSADGPNITIVRKDGSIDLMMCNAYIPNVDGNSVIYTNLPSSVSVGTVIMKHLKIVWGSSDINHLQYSCHHLHICFELVYRADNSAAQLKKMIGNNREEMVEFMMACSIYKNIIETMGITDCFYRPNKYKDQNELNNTITDKDKALTFPIIVVNHNIYKLLTMENLANISKEDAKFHVELVKSVVSNIGLQLNPTYLCDYCKM
nr:MAG: wsv343-like protein [Metapenaeopsis lamellata majanivirus]